MKNRVALIVGTVLLITSAAHAHYVWLERDGGGPALALLREWGPKIFAQNLHESLAKAFEGTYHFNYLFVENGIPYVDVASHLQFLELSKNQSDGAPRIAFLNQTPKGEKRAHYSYIFYQDGDKITLREYGGRGDFRFDCAGQKTLRVRGAKGREASQRHGLSND
jgi:hypothetical protein